MAERTRDHQRLTASRDALTSPRVFAGLDPAIHDEAQRVTSVRFWRLHRLMDARVKPAHDAECVEPPRINMSGYRAITQHFSPPTGMIGLALPKC